MKFSWKENDKNAPKYHCTYYIEIDHRTRDSVNYHIICWIFFFFFSGILCVTQVAARLQSKSEEFGCAIGHLMCQRDCSLGLRVCWYQCTWLVCTKLFKQIVLALYANTFMLKLTNPSWSDKISSTLMCIQIFLVVRHRRGWTIQLLMQGYMAKQMKPWWLKRMMMGSYQAHNLLMRECSKVRLFLHDTLSSR